MKILSTQAGYFEIDVHAFAGAYLHFMCPCGCDSHGGHCSTIPLDPPGQQRTHGLAVTWGWDGEIERPTIIGSILQRAPCAFHGYLRAGVWESCGDGGRVGAPIRSAGALA